MMRVRNGTRILSKLLLWSLFLGGVAVAGEIPIPRPRPEAVTLSNPRHCLARAVYEEARGEEFEGQKMVAFVVRYRSLLGNPGFGGRDLCAVVKAKGQFDGIKGKTWRPSDISAWSLALYAADEVISGRFVPEGELRFATYYLRPETSGEGGKCWFERNLMPIRFIGKHLFFREPLSYEKPAATKRCSQLARR